MVWFKREVCLNSIELNATLPTKLLVAVSGVASTVGPTRYLKISENLKACF